MTIMYFLSMFHDGANKGVTKDLCVNQGGIIVPLNLPFVELVEQFNFFQIVFESGFDARLYYMVYFSARKVYWSLNHLTMPLYQFC